MSRKDQRNQWQREISAKRAEDNLPPSALLTERSIQIHSLQPTKPTACQKILKVQTEFFTAVATWRKIGGVWSCIQADTVIQWMKGMNPNQTAAQLLKMGANYQFLPDPDIRGSAHGAL